MGIATLITLDDAELMPLQVLATYLTCNWPRRNEIGPFLKTLNNRAIRSMHSLTGYEKFVNAAIPRRKKFSAFMREFLEKYDKEAPRQVSVGDFKEALRAEYERVYRDEAAPFSPLRSDHWTPSSPLTKAVNIALREFYHVPVLPSKGIFTFPTG